MTVAALRCRRTSAPLHIPNATAPRAGRRRSGGSLTVPGTCGTSHPAARISSSDVNTYLSETTGEPFTAKDFRTWGASVQAAVFLNELAPAVDEREAEKHVVAAVKMVADLLGNTAAVSRGYYIHPAVLDGYRDASFRERFEEGLALDSTDHLDREEMALLHFLSVSIAD